MQHPCEEGLVLLAPIADQAPGYPSSEDRVLLLLLEAEALRQVFASEAVDHLHRKGEVLDDVRPQIGGRLADLGNLAGNTKESRVDQLQQLNVDQDLSSHENDIDDEDELF